MPTNAFTGLLPVDNIPGKCLSISRDYLKFAFIWLDDCYHLYTILCIIIDKRPAKPNPVVKQDKQAPSQAGCISGNSGINVGYS